MYEKPVNWMTGGEIVGGFYAANPTDSIVAENYPWGWKDLKYNDSNWQSPKFVFSHPKTNAGSGHGWILQPRTTKRQSNRKEPLARVARTSLDNLPQDFQFGDKPIVIPANSKYSLLIDQSYVTLGYPKLILSGGKDSHISVKYSEALYDKHNHKRNRNKIKGKVIKGISDVYIMDGETKRVFQPIWFRTFRFIQIEVETKEQPLKIDNFYNVYSAAEFPVEASFSTNDPLYDKVWDICWHSMEVCAQDNLLSDAYYEQMQYVGDLRPHLKVWTALTGDLTYFRSAMEQFNNSRLPDGNITSCYPLKATFVHPTYSLIWIDMLYDWMMLEGDKSAIEQYVGEIEEVFAYYETLINDQGLVGESKYKMFIEWYVPKAGNSPVNKDGNSAILTLNYAYTLKNAAEIMKWLGYRQKASRYHDMSRKYAEIARKLCFDENRGIYADDPKQTFYDQRASILAILCGAHSAEEARALMRKTLDPKTQFDTKANLFYYFYLFEAMEKTGVGDFTEQLQPWQKIIEMGMSGTPEKRIEQHPRSEIHPWTAHPVHYYFSVVAGIRPTAPGFAGVEIKPNPGQLREIQARYPTVKGKIEVNLSVKSKNKISGKIILPADMTGMYKLEGKKINLKSGVNIIE